MKKTLAVAVLLLSSCDIEPIPIKPVALLNFEFCGFDNEGDSLSVAQATWRKNKEQDLLYYRINLTGDASETRTVGKDTAYNMLLTDGEYQFKVYAVDTAMNESLPSETVHFKIGKTSAALVDQFNSIDTTIWRRGNNSAGVSAAGSLRLVSLDRESGWIHTKKARNVVGELSLDVTRGSKDFCLGLSERANPASKNGFYDQDCVRFYSASAGQSFGLYYLERRAGATVREILVATDVRFAGPFCWKIAFNDDKAVWQYSFDNIAWTAIQEITITTKLDSAFLELAAYDTKSKGEPLVDRIEWKERPAEIDTNVIRVPGAARELRLCIELDKRDTAGVPFDTLAVAVYIATKKGENRKEISIENRKEISIDLGILKIETAPGDTITLSAAQKNIALGIEGERVRLKKPLVF